MKKFLVAILALLYISTSTGAIVQLHYCMGQLTGSDTRHHNSKTCGQCGMEKSGKEKNGCCKDENTYLKSHTDQEATLSVFHPMQVVAVALPVPFFEMTSVDIFTIPAKNPFSHAPPKGSGVAVYIRNCVFLI